ncbi:tyrosine-type recombinase/integrase, partial [uncultured Sphaerochaeta sp.]|uniref:tyrosine-type recombinase/integrase n=2 Tax=Sphaerochaeta TaxID=399320 RepID=UPI00260DF7CD
LPHTGVKVRRLFMYEIFDTAIGFVLDYYSKGEKSKSCLCTYRKYLMKLRAYLVSGGIEYSHMEALKWLSREFAFLRYGQYKVCRRMVFRVNDCILNGTITQREYIYSDFLEYEELDQPQKDLINEFLACKPRNNHTKNNFKHILSSLLLSLQETGFCLKENQVTSSLLDEYYSRPGNPVLNRFYLPQIMRFLYLKGLVCVSDNEIWKYFGIDLNRINNISNLIIPIMETRESNRSQVGDILLGPEILGRLIDYLDEYRYSESIHLATITSFFDLLAFLSTNSLSFSRELLFDWAKANKTEWSYSFYVSLTKTVQLIDLLGSHARVDACDVPTNCRRAWKYIPPLWAEKIVREYLSERRQEGMETSTLYMSRNSCCKFLIYVDSKNIHSFAGITVDLVKEYIKQDKHRTIEGKQAYNCKLRIFLRHLVIQGLLPSEMMLAVPIIIAPKVRIVTVLSEKEREGIVISRGAAETPEELKDNAIVALGLQLGLRASDIVLLKLQDIDWNKHTVKITQKKTGVPLETALPLSVANLLYRYITTGRPKSNLPFVFLHHKAPFSKYAAKKCSCCLTKVLADIPRTSPGFHITRRTFATNLLTSGNGIQIVKSALGQSDLTQLNHYLAVDLVHLRLCPIGLEGINVPGRLL